MQIDLVCALAEIIPLALPSSRDKPRMFDVWEACRRWQGFLDVFITDLMAKEAEATLTTQAGGFGWLKELVWVLKTAQASSSPQNSSGC